MPWTAERTTTNQRVQIGAEATTALGTAVPAGKLLECFDWTFAINGDVNFYTATGHKYPQTQEENTEWVDGTLAGNLDYNGVIYPCAGVFGNAGAVAHGSSVVAKDWIFTPPIFGSIVPRTYTIQQGDAVRAHQVAYGLFTEFAYKGTRKDFSCSGKLLGQPLTDAVTLTASPTAVPIVPVVAKQVNVFLDNTSAALGTTQLLRVLSIDYTMTNVYGPMFVLNRANLGFTAHVDLTPKATVKLKLEADAVGMGLLTNLQVGSTVYLRVDALGAVIDNNQTVSLGAPSAGTFTLTYKGQTTAGIAFGATGATVQTAFTGLSTVGAGNATVSGGAGGPYIISLIGALAGDLTAITGNGTGLTGGTFLITQTQVYAEFKHDMAVKVGKPTAFADDQGVFAIEWELMIVEDPNWTANGQAQIITVTNLLTAL